MAEWKKVIVSGSNAELNQVTASYFVGDGSALTNVLAGSVNIDGFLDGTGITVATTDKLLISDAGVEKYINISQLPFTADTNTTSTADVRSAGALMDDEVTNLADVKAFDTTDYATSTQGTKADAALPLAGGALTGAITTNSTFDGRDVASDGSKLDLIEARADLTDTTNVVAALTAGTNVAIAANGTISSTDTNTNTQLSDTYVIGLFSGGTNVSIASDGTISSTDTNTDTNTTTTVDVTAAGALMDTEVTNLAQVKAFDTTDYATSTQGTKADAALPLAGGALTGAITTNSTFDGRDVASDGSKLDLIEARADLTDTTNVVAALTAGTNVAIAANGTISSTDTNTQNNAATTIAMFSGGTNVTLASNGTISSVNTNTTTTADVKTALGASLGAFTMGDSNDTVTILGNLTVSGATTTLETTNMVVTDSLIGLNNGGGARDVGIVDSRSTSGIGYDTSESRWGFDASGADVATNVIGFDAYAAAVVTSDLVAYKKVGNIRVQSGEIYIYG